MNGTRLPFVRDYDIDEEQFRPLLSGDLSLGRPDRDWAALRLLEHAPYRDIVRLLGFRELAHGWSGWRERLRSRSRQRGLDFLVAWPRAHRPDLV